MPQLEMQSNFEEFLNLLFQNFICKFEFLIDEKKFQLGNIVLLVYLTI